MTLTTTEIQFLELIKAAINGSSFIPDEADWNTLLKMAEQHKLLPIIFDYLNNMFPDRFGSKEFEDARKRVVGQVIHQTSRSMEFDGIYRSLRSEGLHPVVVKGILCSRLYPKPELRITADDDLLIPSDEFDRLHQCLLSLGLSTETPEESFSDTYEITYCQESTHLCIEAHRMLFPDDNSDSAEIQMLFDRVFDDIREDKGYLTMPPHYSFLHLILHAYKHFVYYGIGLRQLCDIGLWAKKYYDEIDWTLLREQCESVHAAAFASVLLAISNEYLGITFNIPDIWNIHPECESLLHDSISGGIFGVSSYSRAHTATMTLNAVASDRDGKKSSILPSIFPGVDYLKLRYPYLKNKPFLLPVAWIHRIVRYADEKNRHNNDSSIETVKLANKRIALMKKYGIID